MIRVVTALPAGMLQELLGEQIGQRGFSAGGKRGQFE